jgi:hypothetical protein
MNKKRFVKVSFLLILSLQLFADDIEVFRCIVGNDTTRIYRGEILWMTRSEFKLTGDASERLKPMNPSNPYFSMFYLNQDFEWEKVWTYSEGTATSATFKPNCVLFTKNNKFDETNDIYRYRGKSLFAAAEKFNIPLVNPSIKKVFFNQKLDLLTEIEITNQYFLNTIREYVLSDSIYQNNKNESVLIVDLEETKSPKKLNLIIKMCSFSTLSREIGEYKYYFSEIDGIYFFFEDTLLSSWFNKTYTYKDIQYKEYYFLNMDNWEIIHDYSIIHRWKFEYNLDSNKINLL